MNTRNLAWQLACTGRYTGQPWDLHKDYAVTAILNLHNGTQAGFNIRGYGHTTNQATYDLMRYLMEMPEENWEEYFESLPKNILVIHAEESRAEQRREHVSKV